MYTAMKILFVYPHEAKTENTSFFSKLNKFSYAWTYLSENLTFPTIAAVTPKEHITKMIDQRYEKIDYSKDYDLVGITATTEAALNAYRIADKFRSRGIKVVMGGWHVSALPEEAKQHADSVVIGESDETWPQLLKDYSKGTLRDYYVQEKPVNLNNIPSPRREILLSSHIDRSLNDARLQATRGCPHGCKYCAIANNATRGIYRTRPIQNVIEEIQTIPQKFLKFCDPSLTINVQYTKELFRNMVGIGKKFSCNGNINILGKDDELLKLARDAGCTSWFVGLESINQKTIDNINKQTNKVMEYKKAIRKIHDYNMIISGNFMFGFDEDTIDVFDRTSEFLDDAEVDQSNFPILTPLPGTPLYEKFDNDGRILTKDWSQYDFGHVVFKPKNMTPEELLHGVQQFEKNYKSISNSFKRSSRVLKYLGLENTTKIARNTLIAMVRYRF